MICGREAWLPKVGLAVGRVRFRTARLRNISIQLKTVLTKIRRDADMLLVKIMFAIAIVSAAVIYAFGAWGDKP